MDKLTNSLRKSMSQDYSNGTQFSEHRPQQIGQNRTLKSFNYVSIESSTDGLRLIAVHNNLDILKQNTLSHIKQNSKLTYQYEVKKGVLKVLYRSQLVYTYKILYLSLMDESTDFRKIAPESDTKDLTTQQNDFQKDAPIFGSIPFTIKDLDEDEEGDSHFNH